MTKRFDLEKDESGAYMSEDPEGEYVTYSDYQALQAKLDRVMLEHCPDEMTLEQKAEWKKHQKAV